MKELLEMLEGKNYADGREIVKNYFSLTEQEMAKMECGFNEKAYADFYCYRNSETESWICFTCDIIENEEEIIYSSDGSWSICENNEVTTELEFKRVYNEK